MSTTPAKKAPVKKAPQDRQPKATETLPKNEDRIEGFELLVPPRQVKGSDQLRLVGRLKTLGIFDGKVAEEGIDFSTMPLDELADFIDYLEERFAVNSEEFADFTRGSGGMERALELAIAYANSLGEEKSS